MTIKKWKRLAALIAITFLACNREIEKHSNLSSLPKYEEVVMHKNEIAHENINVHAKLRWSRKSPGLPQRQGYVEIWIKGAKFRVRDDTGRYLYEILGDIAAKRGLGQGPRTIEEIMDISSRVLNEGPRGPTEVVGDRATGEGLIQEPESEKWAIEAEKIVPAAEQIFTDGLENQLRPMRTLTRFGRKCTEYLGPIERENNGFKYKSEVRRIVSPPFVFYDEVYDSENRDHYYTREIVDFEEGKVTDEDVTSIDATGVDSHR